jgi:hydrogenase expression/formation protein HypC
MHHGPVHPGFEGEQGEGAVCLAIPGQIVMLVDEDVGLASVEIAGVRRKVNVGLLDSAAPGDWVLVHVGFAIARVDEEEARATLALLREMGAEYETELEELKASAIE